MLGNLSCAWCHAQDLGAFYAGYPSIFYWNICNFISFHLKNSKVFTLLSLYKYKNHQKITELKCSNHIQPLQYFCPLKEHFFCWFFILFYFGPGIRLVLSVGSWIILNFQGSGRTRILVSNLRNKRYYQELNWICNIWNYKLQGSNYFHTSILKRNKEPSRKRVNNIWGNTD